ncbi:TldD/PmbA family protein [Rhodobacteraceae bacterium NNCM2]|nr:TldD/PmbA family protein [Coraliihabitans acroporae]
MTDTDQDIAERLIAAAQSAGADAADALVVASDSTFVGIAEGRLEEAEHAESRDFGLRVLVGQRQACVSSSNPAESVLQEMAARAVAIAREAPEDPFCGLADSVTAAELDLDLEDRAADPAPEALEEMARAAEAAALSVAGVEQVEQASASIGRMQISIAATNGFRGSYGRTSRSVSASAIAGAGLARERDWASETRRHMADLPDSAGIGRQAGERASERLSPRKPPSGSFPVLYDNRVSGGLIGHLLSAINGTSIARGSSWLLDAMGKTVMPAGIDLIEDPLLRRGPASRPFDAEGMAAAERKLVEDGVLTSWVLDLATARKLGLASTGNARRGTGAPPSPGTSNIRITQGAQSREDLIRDMGTGLIVTSMIGSSINATTGAYSRGASGFWVEGGEIAFPVNEVTVAGSLPEMLTRFTAANDADPHRAVSAPSLLVEGLTVGA